MERQTGLNDVTLHDLLARLDGVRRTSRGFMSRCPSHPDKHPSLSIREGERGLLLYCWAGCTVAAICHALGIEVSGLFFDERGIPSRCAPRSTPRPLTTREMECMVWTKAVRGQNDWLKRRSL